MITHNVDIAYMATINIYNQKPQIHSLRIREMCRSHFVQAALEQTASCEMWFGVENSNRYGFLTNDEI